MTARKPVEPGCNGGAFCPIPGHVTRRGVGATFTLSHKPMTAGQRKTLRERWAAAHIQDEADR